MTRSWRATIPRVAVPRQSSARSAGVYYTECAFLGELGKQSVKIWCGARSKLLAPFEKRNLERMRAGALMSIRTLYCAPIVWSLMKSARDLAKLARNGPHASLDAPTARGSRRDRPLERAVAAHRIRGGVQGPCHLAGSGWHRMGDFAVDREQRASPRSPTPISLGF